MHILVVSEGNLDVGSSGAVTLLVRRVLGAALGREVADHEVETETQVRLHRFERNKGLGRKLHTAMRMARARRCDAAAFVIDRDGPANAARVDVLRAARDEAARTGEPIAARVAVGVAVETVESWLLADENALNTGLRPTTPIPRQRDPERWSPARTPAHPKERFIALLGASSLELSAEDLYGAVAQGCDLAELERRSDSFRAFASELRRLLS